MQIILYSKIEKHDNVNVTSISNNVWQNNTVCEAGSYNGGWWVTLVVHTHVPSAEISVKPNQNPFAHQVDPESFGTLSFKISCIKRAYMYNSLHEVHFQTTDRCKRRSRSIAGLLWFYNTINSTHRPHGGLTCSSKLSITTRSAFRLMQSCLLSGQFFFIGWLVRTLEKK